MDTVQVYYTNFESKPPVRDICWKDCGFTMKNHVFPFPQDGSGHIFEFKIWQKITTTPSSLVVVEKNNVTKKNSCDKEYSYPKEEYTAEIHKVQLSAIRVMRSYFPCILTFKIHRRPIYYRIKFSHDLNLKWLIGCIMSEISCFTWDKKYTDLSDRRFVLENKILRMIHQQMKMQGLCCRQQVKNNEIIESKSDTVVPAAEVSALECLYDSDETDESNDTDDDDDDIKPMMMIKQKMILMAIFLFVK
nr:uncharacterized protein LOC124497434 [Dermatophagoides farinae]